MGSLAYRRLNIRDGAFAGGEERELGPLGAEKDLPGK
jgi:hypothetical protein